MRKLATMMSACGLMIGCASQVAPADTEGGGTEQGLRGLADSLGFDGAGGVFDGDDLTVEGDIVLSSGHAVPIDGDEARFSERIGFSQEHVEGLPDAEFQELVGIANDGKEPFEKARFWKDTSFRVFNNAPGRINICLWVDNDGDDAAVLWKFSADKVRDAINALDTRLNMVTRTGPNGNNCPEGYYRIEVSRMGGQGFENNACARAEWPVRVFYNGGQWSEPGRHIYIHKTNPCTVSSDSVLMHEFLHSIGFSHSNDGCCGTVAVPGTNPDLHKASIMRNDGKLPASGLQTDDKNALRSIYPD